MRNVICRFGRFRKTVFRCAGGGVIFLLMAACGGDDKNSNPYDKPHNPGQAVEVRSVSPVSGGIGTKVVVSGSNFGNDTTGVQLYFNQKKALIMNIQDNAIYALTPRQPGDFSTIRVVVKGKEAILDGMQFQYFIRSTVTTVSGKYGVNVAEDGPALQATYGRPVNVCANSDGSLVFIADDGGATSGVGRLRMFSTKDNVVSTVIDGLAQPWQMAFNTAEDRLFVVEREEANRPILFYVLSQNTNWVQREIYYDQRDENGVYIAGAMPRAGLTADDTYVYMLSNQKLIRIHQITKKVEAISGVLISTNWSYPVFNKIDKKLYLVSYEQARIYRLDPYHTPEGRTTPWLTIDDMEHIAGMSRGTAREGNGLSIRFGNLDLPGFDQDGNMYIPDETNQAIWKLDADMNGAIIAGTVGQAGYRDGPPLEAMFYNPYGVSVTRDGLIYVAEARNFVIRCIAIQ